MLIELPRPPQRPFLKWCSRTIGRWNSQTQMEVLVIWRLYFGTFSQAASRVNIHPRFIYVSTKISFVATQYHFALAQTFAVFGLCSSTEPMPPPLPTPRHTVFQSADIRPAVMSHLRTCGCLLSAGHAVFTPTQVHCLLHNRLQGVC